MLLPTRRELGILAQLEGTAWDRALGCSSRAAGWQKVQHPHIRAPAQSPFFPCYSQSLLSPTMPCCQLGPCSEYQRAGSSSEDQPSIPHVPSLPGVGRQAASTGVAKHSWLCLA